MVGVARPRVNSDGRANGRDPGAEVGVRGRGGNNTVGGLSLSRRRPRGAAGASAAPPAPAPGSGAPAGGRRIPWLTSSGLPSRFCTGASAPPAGGAPTTGAVSRPGWGMLATSMPMACIRARCWAAWVLAQGNFGPGGKYCTSSYMYLPVGRVMPAYSTWQPVVVASRPPTTTAAQGALRRAGEPSRGDRIVSTLLGWSSRCRARPAPPIESFLGDPRSPARSELRDLATLRGSAD